MAAAARAPAAVAAAALGSAAAAATGNLPYDLYRGPKGLIFLGSWTGDSVLMQLKPRTDNAAEGPAAKRQKRVGGADMGGDGGGAGAALTNRSAAVAAAAAAGAAAAAKVAAAEGGVGPQRFNLRLLDSLPSLGGFPKGREKGHVNVSGYHTRG